MSYAEDVLDGWDAYTEDTIYEEVQKHRKRKTTMAKRMSYEFLAQDTITDVIEVRYAHVNQPDPNYGDYKVTMTLPENDEHTKSLFAKTLEFENRVRKDKGLPTVDYPSNWTRRGQPRLENGEWLIEAKMSVENSKQEAQSPAIADVYGAQTGEVKIWGGDLVSVTFGIGVWYDATTAGTRYFLKGVQLIKPGERKAGAGGVKFKDMSDQVVVQQETSEPTPAVQDNNGDTYDDDSVPF